MKLPYGELILWLFFRTAKYPYGEISYGEISYSEISFGEISSHSFELKEFYTSGFGLGEESFDIVRSGFDHTSET